MKPTIDNETQFRAWCSIFKIGRREVTDKIMLNRDPTDRVCATRSSFSERSPSTKKKTPSPTLVVRTPSNIQVGEWE